MTPPGRNSARIRSDLAWVKTLAIVGFVVLLIGAGGVIFILPFVLDDWRKGSKVAGAPPAPSVTAEIPRAPARPPPPETGLASGPATPSEDAAKQESERLLDQALELRARLENGGVRIWGAERLTTSYPEALGELVGANAAFDRKQYGEAVSRYRASISTLRRLDDSRPERLARALASGQAALLRQDPETAARQFEIALAIEPEHGQAKHGLSRAKNLRRVVELTAAADALAAQEKFASAKRAYQQATGIDPEFAPAREGLARVERTLSGRDFNRSISTAMAALEREDFPEAEGALSRASRLRPGASEIGDIRQRLTAIRRTGALRSLWHDARRHAEGEDWERALATYDAALEIDATASFAVRGKEVAEKYLDLHGKIDFYLARPDRLHSPRPRAHAREVVDAAGAGARPGPVLTDKRDRLRSLITAAAEPVFVTLRSDGNTQVTIHRVGRLGAFSERRLRLPPGSYTAVGNRRGYRDVRVVFRVPGADGNSVIVVRCEDPI